MKNAIKIGLIIILIITVAVCAWFIGYHTRKSQDNLPSLESIAKMDEGTAMIMGIFLLALWLFIVLVPVIGFLRYAYTLNKKYLLVCIFSMFALMTVCMAICGWDIVHFLVS